MRHPKHALLGMDSGNYPNGEIRGFGDPQGQDSYR